MMFCCCRRGGIGRGGHAGPSNRGGRMNPPAPNRMPMKRPSMTDRSPRGGMGNKRMRMDSFGRGGSRGPMPTGPRIPRDAWNSNWGNNMGGGSNYNNMGGGSGGGFNNFNSNMGSGMGNMGMGGGMSSNMGGSDMGNFGNMSRMDNYGPRDNFYDDSGVGSRSYGRNDYDDMGSSYNSGGNYSSGGYDNYDSYSTGGQQSRSKGSLNPQQAANAINLLAGLSSLMG